MVANVSLRQKCEPISNLSLNNEFAFLTFDEYLFEGTFEYMLKQYGNCSN